MLDVLLPPFTCPRCGRHLRPAQLGVVVAAWSVERSAAAWRYVPLEDRPRDHGARCGLRCATAGCDAAIVSVGDVERAVAVRPKA